MKRILQIAVAVAAAFALSSSALAATPAPQASEEMTLLQGVDALALDSAEMDAIHGALTGGDIFSAMMAKALLIKDPVLMANTVKWLNDHQAQIIDFFNRLLAFRR